MKGRWTLGALGVMLGLALGFTYWRHRLMATLLIRADQSVAELSHQFAQDPGILKTFLERHPNAIFVAAQWVPTEFRSGYLNQTNLEKAPKELKELFPDVEWHRFEKALSSQVNVSNTYVHGVHVYYKKPTDTGAGLDVGELKAAFLIPGAVTPQIYLGRGYLYVAYALWALCLALGGLMVLQRRRAGQAILTQFPSHLVDEEGPQSDLTWLETDTGATQPIYLDDQGRSWAVFFPVASLHQWHVSGDYYVREHQLVLKPWATNLTRPDVRCQAPFEFLVRGLRLAGPDAFVILFELNTYQLYWVIGGWGNTRSELAGYPQTAKPVRIDSNRWYVMELRFDGQFLEGLLNGERQFQIAITEIDRPSPDVGFGGGFGVAVWGALVKYTDIRMYADA